MTSPTATFSTDGLVFGPGPAGRCDDYRVGGAIVDRDEIGGLWRMWYYCRDRAFDRPAPATLGSGWIAHATSRDGITWIRHDGPLHGGAVFGPSDEPEDFDSGHVGLTDVTRCAGGWLMWYFGGNAAIRETNSRLGAVAGLGMRIGLARSRDGITWTRLRGPLTSGAIIDYAEDRVYAGWPNAIFDGRRFILQYTAPTLDLGRFETLTAISEDGLHWQKQGPLHWADGPRAYDVGGLITRQILLNPLPGGRRWLMVYAGTDIHHKRSIAAAESDDAVTWTHVGDGPFLEAGVAGAWDDFGVAVNRLVPHGARLHLYYYGFQSLEAKDAPRGIGLAISDRGTLRDFVRVAAR